MPAVRGKIAPPRKAIILAAGLGTRMRPLTGIIPKPLLPLWGKPLIDHVIERLASWGVREAVINLHHKPELIIEHIHRKRRANIHIHLSYEPHILGTGGAVRNTGWFLDDDYFWVVNSDIAFDVSSGPFIRQAEKHRPLSVLWLHEQAGPRTVEMKDGTITNLASARPGTGGTYTFTGLQLLSPKILAYLPKTGFSTITDAFNRAMRDKQALHGICEPGSFWADAGTPESYTGAHAEIQRLYRAHLPGGSLYSAAQQKKMGQFRKKGATVHGFVSLGKNVHIEPGAKIRDSVILDDCTVRRSADIGNTVTAPGTVVTGYTRRLALQAPALKDPVTEAVISNLKWNPRKTVAQPLEPRGSSRTLTRINFGTRKAIVVKYSTEREENRLYVEHSRFLEKMGVRVPVILADLPGINAYALEDVGDVSLKDYLLEGNPDEAGQIYRKVIGQIIALHRKGPSAAKNSSIELNRPFSASLYKWEHELFRKFCLDRRSGASRREKKAIMHELEGIARKLTRLPRTIVHRDLQSSNILVYKNSPVLIDFQGMRRGPAEHDLASLLFDPYVSLTPELQVKLAYYYAEQAGESPGKLYSNTVTAGIERLVQAVGAFGRLGSQPGTRRFAGHIPSAFSMLKRLLAQCNYCSHLSMYCDSFLRVEGRK